MGDHFLVRRDAQVLQNLRHVLTNAQVARFIHARRPLEVDCAGNVSTFGRDHFFARIFGRCARVPDCQVICAQAALQVFTGGGGFVVECQRNRAASNQRHLGAQWQCLRFPGQHAAVEIVVTAMTDDVQQPDETPGPAAAFVIVDNVDRIGVVAQLAEQLLKVGRVR